MNNKCDNFIINYNASKMMHNSSLPILTQTWNNNYKVDNLANQYNKNESYTKNNL